MLESSWYSSIYAATKLGISESELCNLREYGLFKPGIHWKSSPSGQVKPWCPEVIYNVNSCKKVISNQNSFKFLNKYVA